MIKLLPGAFWTFGGLQITFWVTAFGAVKIRARASFHWWKQWLSSIFAMLWWSVMHFHAFESPWACTRSMAECRVHKYRTPPLQCQHRILGSASSTAAVMERFQPWLYRRNNSTFGTDKTMRFQFYNRHVPTHQRKFKNSMESGCWRKAVSEFVDTCSIILFYNSVSFIFFPYFPSHFHVEYHLPLPLNFQQWAN